MPTNVHQEAVFIGANQQNQTSDHNKALGIVAFGAGKTIALWDPLNKDNEGIVATLKGHTATVTCVRFIQGTEYMVSASEDFHVKVWKYLPGGSWECVQTITKYDHTIVTLAVLPGVLAIGCANGEVSLWYESSETNDDVFLLGAEFEVERNFLPLSLSLSNVEENRYLLAVGGTNVHIFVYSFVLDQGISECEKRAKLEGHEDWVKSLAFRHQETPGDYLLCSGSQDRYIRIWRIRTNGLIVDEDEDENMLTLLNNKQYKFHMAQEKLRICINFEALIMGHDDWISSLQWHETRLQLLASTADTSLMIWEPDEASGVWVCGLRLGELSSKGASTATGSSGGFWSCLWFTKDNTDYILTNGKTGAWRVWSTTDGVNIDERVGVSGATNEVTDIAWAPNGEYLLSTSLDQTTRLYAPWIYEADGSKRNTATWHEFSRPQIHGYDMICVEPISDTRFVSGGDEKIVRSFDEPRGVAELLKKFVHISVGDEEAMPESATVPVLGLSNKAAGDEGQDEDENDGGSNDDIDGTNKNVSYEIVTGLTHPPIEDQLQRLLLWPEIEKLYGHGYEITCLDVSPDRKLVASACRSNTPQHAVIRIFSIDTWLEIKPTLAFHSLTINRLSFSPDNKFLLAVSRDRKWSVWERNFDDNTFILKCKNEKPHTRIVWDSDWAPQEFGNTFVTCARDRTIKLWTFDNDSNDYKLVDSVKHDKPVTAVAIYPTLIDGKILVAAGLEDGSVFLYNFGGEKFELVNKLEERITPADKITRLRWSSWTQDGKLLLASSSSDSSTRVYSVEL